MLYKYPSDKQMHYNREFECYFDYIIVDGDSHEGYFATMKEAKNSVNKKPAPKRRTRKKTES